MRDTLRPGIALPLLLVVALAAQASASLGGLYGEQDAARLAVDALAWLEAGVRTQALSEYRYYTSPGYIALIMGAVQAGRIPGLHPAQILGALNFILAVAIVVPAYRLAVRLTDPDTAFLAVLAMIFMPMAWHAGTYGFPTLPAVFCLLCAYLLYDRHLTGEDWLGPKTDIAVVVLLLTACVVFKGDSYLGAAGFPALLVVRGVLTVRRLLVTAALLAIPVIIAVAAAQLLLQASPTTVQYMQGYERQYPTTLRHLRSWWHVEGLLMGFGFYSAFVFAVGFVATLVRRGWPLALLLTTWMAFPMAFWFFREGDSARHHLPEAFPMALGIGIAFALLPGRRWLAVAGVAVLVVANYVRYPATDENNFRPSGRVPETSALLRERVANYHRLAAQYVAQDAPRKVMLGVLANPYVDSEVLLRAERVVSVARHPLLGYDAIEIHSRRGDEDRYSVSVRVNSDQAPEAARRFREAGYVPYTIEYDLATGKPVSAQRLRTLEAP